MLGMKEVIIRCEDIQEPNAIAWSEALTVDAPCLFYASSSDFDSFLPKLHHFLSIEEHEKALRLRRENQRNTFILNHSLLRLILSVKTGISPFQIGFELGSYGKPYLSQEIPDIHFNISDSDDVCLLGFWSNPLGVDIEQIRSDVEAEAIAARFFSIRECRHIGRNGPEHFYKYWSRKEAVLKATGLGITTMLPCIGVVTGINILQSGCAGIAHQISENHHVQSFRLDGYFASIAASNRIKDLKLCRVKPSNLTTLL
jgi:4'-phosphopantetheinyl transferase